MPLSEKHVKDKSLPTSGLNKVSSPTPQKKKKKTKLCKAEGLDQNNTN